MTKDTKDEGKAERSKKMNGLISLSEVKKCGILTDRVEILDDVVAMGNNWFADNKGRVCYKVVKDGQEYRIKQVKKLKEPVEKKIKEKEIKEKEGKRIYIKCIDCGAMRNIAIQDKFQVKRCKECQLKYTKKRRQERRKEKKDVSGR